MKRLIQTTGLAALALIAVACGGGSPTQAPATGGPAASAPASAGNVIVAKGEVERGMARLQPPAINHRCPSKAPTPAHQIPESARVVPPLGPPVPYAWAMPPRISMKKWRASTGSVLECLSWTLQQPTMTNRDAR
jgi:hypothetical protein